VYMRLKQTYAADTGIGVDVLRVSADKLNECVQAQNQDSLVHGIIVQLPAPGAIDIQKTLNAIKPDKDVDSLGQGSLFTSATAEAIVWLLSGNSIDLKNKNITIVGQGKLVGAPLGLLLESSGLSIVRIDENTKHKSEILQNSDIIVSAAGVPNLIHSSDVKSGVIIIDAGVATDKGSLVGDVSDEVRLRNDIIITPKKGGVGPLTIAVLFDHVLTAAEKAVPSKAV
jgi:methylenetetrahydrofolate dehydrogenase (NADP+) / methenyltetrahydrofolate cyclohydrolase